MYHKNENLEEHLSFPLYAFSKEIINQYTIALKPYGFTYTQYLCIVALLENNSLIIKDLGETLFLDSATITPVIKKLEKAGYVKRSRSFADERLVYVSLTKKGQALKEPLASIPDLAESHLLITKASEERLKKILLKFIDKKRKSK